MTLENQCHVVGKLAALGISSTLKLSLQAGRHAEGQNCVSGFHGAHYVYIVVDCQQQSCA